MIANPVSSSIKPSFSIAFSLNSLALLKRCFCEKYQKRKPTYKNATVCKEWLDFQNFAE